MEWRRGFLLAAVNVAMAVPLIMYTEWLAVRYTKSHIQASMVFAAQEGAGISFDPCQMWSNYPPSEQVVQFGNFPAFVITGWGIECPARWTIAGLLDVNHAPGDSAWRDAQRLLDLILCSLIAFQWFLIGSFPFTPRRSWWREPGMFITLCTALATCIALIPLFDIVARLPAMGAFLGWCYWMVVAFARAIRFTWRHTAGRNPGNAH